MTEWVITCNTNAYNVVGAFDKLDTVDWKQSTNVNIGDIIYIYVGAPVRAIAYKCEAIQVELSEDLIDDSEFVLDDSNYGNYGRYMRLHLLEKYEEQKLGYNFLKANGLMTVQGPSKVSEQLSAYIFGVVESAGNSFDQYVVNKGAAHKTRREAITILYRAYDRPVRARELTDIMYEIGKHPASVNAELSYMEQKGIAKKVDIDVPYSYVVNGYIESPEYFMVYQENNFKEESSGEYLWKSDETQSESPYQSNTSLKDVKKDDVIFHSYKQRIVAVSVAKADAYKAEGKVELFDSKVQKNGWRVDTAYYIFPHPIDVNDYIDQIKNLLTGQQGPFDDNDYEKKEYIYVISQDIARFILDATSGNKTVDTSKHLSEEILLIAGSASVVIDKLVAQYVKKLPSILPREKELEELRKKFVSDYNMNKLMNMTKEEYVVGLGRKDSFCYRIETELQDLGNIHGSTSVKFGLYYGKSGDDTEEKYRCTKKFGDNPDAALEEIKKQIVFLRMDGEKKDLEAIRKCELAPLFRGKILAVFFPEDYLCIFTDEHLDYFMKKLGIVSNSSYDILDKQRKLVEWKNSRVEMKDWNNHLFSSFLYDSFGRPFEDMKADKDVQEERDKAYPKDYVAKLGITIGTWKELLSNPKIFRETDIELLKRFYRADNHATTCYDLAIQDGVSPTSYISPVVSLAKRISSALKLSPIIGDDGARVWWRIPFWGRYREDGKFEWKLRPKLAKAMVALYPELDINADFEAEEKEDNSLIEELKQANVVIAEPFSYSGEPKEKEAPIYTNGHKTYPRDRQTAINALAHANYECEIDNNHPTFIRKKSNIKYTEPHHLIPMAFSDEFEVSLDVEENIVSLCSNCHNQIHYGKDADKLIAKLYEERKDVLKKVGIEISLDRLLAMYGYSNLGK